MKPELYCKLFIHTTMPIEELFDLRDNDEYCPGSQDFLFWKYFADIETWVSDETDYIQCVNSLILFLTDKRIDAIAACDFEDKLFASYEN